MYRCFIAFLTVYLFNNLSMTNNTVMNNNTYRLNIIHINDFHASYEPIEETEDKHFVEPCKDPIGNKCVGGYARMLYSVRELAQDAKNKNIPYLYLNAGDIFGGSIWYTIGRWNLTAEFFNMFPADAVVLGHHEFDHGIAGLAPFVRGLHSPITVCNINTSNEPSLWSIKKSVIVNKGGLKIGIIGAIAQMTSDFARKTGKLRFLDIATAITNEANKLTSKNINIIIVLSHCGFNIDKEIAENLGSIIDVIVGGHTHTLLNNKGFMWPGKYPGHMKPFGVYPTVIKHFSGKKVLIVQAGSFARYVGNLFVDFNQNGDIVNYKGSSIYLDSSAPRDKTVLQKLQKWKLSINKVKKIIIGKTIRDLTTSNCAIQECTAGNFYTTAILNKYLRSGCFGNRIRSSNTSFAIITSGTLRGDISKGCITIGQIYNMVPYNATLMEIVIKGQHIKTIFEESISNYYKSNTKNYTYDKKFLQVAGIKVTYDLKNPINSRVHSMMIRCHSCNGKVYNNISADKYYKVITTRNIAHGGLGYTVLVTRSQYYREFSSVHVALIDYLHQKSPITIFLENRIIFK